MASFVRYLSPGRLFCGGCLWSLGGSFSCSFSSGSCFFTAAAACLRLAGFGILKHGLVVVYQLDEAGLGVVTETVAGFENAGVSAGTLADFLSNFLEEYLHGLFVLEVAEDEAAVGHCIFLGTVDNGLGVNAESLSLCQRGVDTLVEDERDGHIGQQRRTVSGLAAKVIEFLIVSHRGLFFIEFVFRDVHAEGEIEARKEVLKLDEGLFAEVAELFRQKGMRITKQRRLILDIVFEHDCICCKEIYYQALKKDKNVGIATVYRMVNALADLGVFQINVPYRLVDPVSAGGQNGCRVLLKNQTVVEFDPNEWNDILTEALQKKGYEGPEIERVIL